MAQCSPLVDRTLAALADPTRRGILERLGREDASISQLAEAFEMTLTGIKTHVQILEEAGLLTTEKVGRVRTCRLGPRRLDDEGGLDQPVSADAGGPPRPAGRVPRAHQGRAVVSGPAKEPAAAAASCAAGASRAAQEAASP